MILSKNNSKNNDVQNKNNVLSILYYYLSGFSCLDFFFFFFWLKNTLIPLYLSRDKTKGQSGENTTLTPTKTLPKK